MSTQTQVQPKSNSSLNLQEHELIRALTSGDNFLTPKKRSDEHESFTSEESPYFSSSISGPILDLILGPILDLTQGPILDLIQGPILDLIQGPNLDLIQAPVLDLIQGPILDLIQGPILDLIRSRPEAANPGDLMRNGARFWTRKRPTARPKEVRDLDRRHLERKTKGTAGSKPRDGTLSQNGYGI